jgi:hypothetical protein
MPPIIVPMRGDGTIANPIVVDAKPSYQTTPISSALSTTGATGALTTDTRVLFISNPTQPVVVPVSALYLSSTKIGDLAALTLER